MAKKKTTPVDLSEYFREIGLEIKRLREKAGLTQAELASEITEMGYHLTAPHLKKIENGQDNYTVQYLYAISKYFDRKPRITPQKPGNLVIFSLGSRILRISFPD